MDLPDFWFLCMNLHLGQKLCVDACFRWYLTLECWLGMVESSSQWGHSFGFLDAVTLLFSALIVECSWRLGSWQLVGVLIWIFLMFGVFV